MNKDVLVKGENDLALKLIINSDYRISREAKRLNALANTLKFEKVMEFTLGNDTPEIPNMDLKSRGVYLFRILNTKLELTPGEWVAEFNKRWRYDLYGRWIPKVWEGRVKKHEKFGDWVPLYIGISNNVYNRITQHICQPIEKTSFSMKLKAQPVLYGERFEISWIPLRIANYNMIAPAIERSLRERYNPIVGKQ